MINRRKSFGGTATENIVAAIKKAEKQMKKEMEIIINAKG